MDGTDKPGDYLFSDRERSFFAAQIAEVNKSIAMMNNAANLIVVQNDLPGKWVLKPDGSGLTRADT